MAIFIKMEGLDGGSTESNHEGWSDALTVSHGVSQAAGKSGSRSRRSAVNFEPIEVVKELDLATPSLAKAAGEGATFDEVTIDVTTPTSNGPFETFWSYKLGDVLIASWQIVIAETGAPMETFTLSFEKLEGDYRFMTPTGATSSVPFQWKVTADV